MLPLSEFEKPIVRYFSENSGGLFVDFLDHFMTGFTISVYQSQKRIDIQFVKDELPGDALEDDYMAELSGGTTLVLQKIMKLVEKLDEIGYIRCFQTARTYQNRIDIGTFDINKVVPFQMVDGPTTDLVLKYIVQSVSSTTTLDHYVNNGFKTDEEAMREAQVRRSNIKSTIALVISAAALVVSGIKGCSSSPDDKVNDTGRSVIQQDSSRVVKPPASSTSVDSL